MLHSLTVLNGELSPAFEANNLMYTVAVKDDVTALELDYVLADEAEIQILGNNDFTTGENTVMLEITQGEKNEVYTLLVTKEAMATTSTTLIEPEHLEVQKNLPDYVAPLIAIICFLLIFFFFWLIFIPKKHKK